VAARAQVAGRRVTIELEGLRFSKRRASELSRAPATHWSHWIDAWCVDWDHRDGVVNVGAYVARRRREVGLELCARHTYAKAGEYIVLVKVFDVLGGEAMAAVPVNVV
jgi:hypothetical protein